MYRHVIPFQAYGCLLLLCKHVSDVFPCISPRSISTLLPVYCWPCNFVYDVFVAGGFSCTLYSDSGSPSPFLFMVITREHFILAFGECLLCLCVGMCVKIGKCFLWGQGFCKMAWSLSNPNWPLSFVLYGITTSPPPFFPFKHFFINLKDKID